MNIWKKPAPSINTHSSDYSNGPQGPLPISLPQGCNSSYTLHVCDALNIPSFNQLAKPAVTQGLSPPPQGPSTSRPLLYLHMHTYVSPVNREADQHFSLQAHDFFTQISKGRFPPRTLPLGGECLLSSGRLAERCWLLFFWNTWFIPHRALRAEMPCFYSTSLAPKI